MHKLIVHNILTSYFVYFHQIFNQELESPVFQYDVTVSHKTGSPCDAHDVIIVDDTKNVDVDRSSVDPRSDVVITYPTVNIYKLVYKIPKLKGELDKLL